MYTQQNKTHANNNQGKFSDTTLNRRKTIAKANRNRNMCAHRGKIMKNIVTNGNDRAELTKKQTVKNAPKKGTK